MIFNKPIYVGISVYEFSKLHMFKFYYNVIKEYFGDKAILVSTDTDLLVNY